MQVLVQEACQLAALPLQLLADFWARADSPPLWKEYIFVHDECYILDLTELGSGLTHVKLMATECWQACWQAHANIYAVLAGVAGPTTYRWVQHVEFHPRTTNHGKSTASPFRLGVSADPGQASTSAWASAALDPALLRTLTANLSCSGRYASATEPIAFFSASTRQRPTLKARMQALRHPHQLVPEEDRPGLRRLRNTWIEPWSGAVVFCNPAFVVIRYYD